MKNSKGEPVFLLPLRDEDGNLLKTVGDRPVYPTPVRDPQTQDFAFDGGGAIVLSPPLLEAGRLVEDRGIPQFRPPAYAFEGGKLRLQQDEAGNYRFCDAERDTKGNILRDPSGKPVFQSALPGR